LCLSPTGETEVPGLSLLISWRYALAFKVWV
jgi:hypothetical protein